MPGRRIMSRLWKNLTASKTSWLFMGIFVVCLLALCAIGIWTLVTENLPENPEELDAAGLEQTDADIVSNVVNPSQMPDNSFIYDVSIEELDSADAYMDSQTVQVTGEVVGDRIIAEGDPDNCWIVLQSTGESDAEVSVFMPVSASEVIDTYGAYGQRGTRLQVSGVFNLACRDHHGTTEIHSADVIVVEKGTIERLPLEPRRMVIGLVLIMIGSIAILAYNVLSERQR